MKKTCVVIIFSVVTALMVAGCGSGVSDNEPIVEVKQEAKAMDASQLKDVIAKYQQAIESKKPQIVKLQNSLKAIPMDQLMGKEAKAIREEMGQITSSIKALTERMKIYAIELSRK